MNSATRGLIRAKTSFSRLENAEISDMKGSAGIAQWLVCLGSWIHVLVLLIAV